MQKDASLAQRILDKIRDLLQAFRTLGNKEARAEYKRLKAAEKLYMEAMEKAGGKDTENGKVRYLFKSYSEKQIQNWKDSKSIVIYESKQQFMEFIDKAVNDRQFNKKIYFGAIDQLLANQIASEIGVNAYNYNCSLSANEIRKIFKDHGSESKEASRGQRAITKNDIMDIPSVIESPDLVKKSDNDYNGKPAIIFSKDGVTVIGIISDKHMDLFVQTAYAKKRKGILATPIDEQASINTPEAGRGTDSSNSIPEKSENVNTKSQFSLKPADEELMRETARRRAGANERDRCASCRGNAW